MTAPFPIVICEIEKSDSEIIRVALDHYAGRNTIDCRIWYRAGNGWKPSRQGITTTLKNLPTLAEAFAAALNRADELGLIDRRRDL
jgi:hypothetical protein